MKFRFKELKNGQLELQYSYLGIVWREYYFFRHYIWINYQTRYPDDGQLNKYYSCITWYDLIISLQRTPEEDGKYERCCIYLQEFKKFRKELQDDYRNQRDGFEFKRFIS